MICDRRMAGREKGKFCEMSGTAVMYGWETVTGMGGGA